LQSEEEIQNDQAHQTLADHTAYDHRKYQFRRNFLRVLMRQIGFRFLARIHHIEGQENIPLFGPTIVMINHIAFIDPFVVLAVYPRNIVPLAKREVYRYPIVGIFPHIWGVIPVDRDGGDRQALRKSEHVLEAGETILIAPEGTRGPALQNVHDGVAFLAARTGAPILPTAITQTEGYPTWPLSKRWRQPGAGVRFGQPFKFKALDRRPNRDELKNMTDEAMIVLARLLPEKHRGVYSGRINEPLDRIQFIEPQRQPG
jgi:1-acyl-sn-glycerol-3-phosphate acyltransferase